MPRVLAALTACLLSVPLAVESASAQPERPNIVFILADDLGYGDLGCYGNASIRTPAIDRLAAEGVRLTSSYASGPECTPTRAALMTGRYPQRVRGLECAIGTGNVGRYDDAIDEANHHNLGLPAAASVLARTLHEQGYQTALIGKWHLGYEPRFAPGDQGFDRTFYCIGGGMDYFFHHEPGGMPVLFEDGQPITRPGYFTDQVTANAVDVITRAGAKPLFLYVPYTAPHAPFQGPDDPHEQPLADDDPAWDQSSAPPATYRAMIERMDQGVGQILAALEKQGMRANTLVIFASDNGGTKSGSNGPLQGFKGSTYEGGIRVPAIARWPGVIPAGIQSAQVLLTMDWTATMLAAAGVDRDPLALDGIDLLDEIAGKKPQRERTVFWRKRRGEQTWRGLRSGDWKLVERQDGPRRERHLFNLASDIGESRDLAAANPAQFDRLGEALSQWEQAVKPAADP